jgi:N-acetylglucosamine kinase-like BadF-type ATPase
VNAAADRPAVFAVDGGNSKADAVLVATDGTLLARFVGPTVSHQAVGLDEAMANLRDLAGRLAADAHPGPDADADDTVARFGAYCLAGADSPADVRRLRTAIRRLGLTIDIDVRNDTEAPLSAGTPEGWGVAVVSGSGMNAIGRAPDGRVVRFAGLGDLSGDRGGGGAAGILALGAAVAAEEHRGPRTTLEAAVPSFFGLRRPLDVAFAIDQGRLFRKQLRELSPAVFGAAAAGDRVARGIVNMLADECVSYANAAIVRLRLATTDVPVVLSGGTFRASDGAFLARIHEGILDRAPAATIHVLTAPPVLGAALLGLDALGAPDAAKRRLTNVLAAS